MLFIIYTLISYSKKNKIKYIINKQTNGFTSNEIYKRDNFTDSIFRQLIDKISKDDINTSFFYKIKEKKNSIYEKLPFKKKCNILLQGYFQNYKYFESYHEEINELLKIKEKQEKLKSKVKILENSISLHFRIGDYKDANHPILNLNYYKKALARIINLTNIKEWNVYICYEFVDNDIVNKHVNELTQTFKNLNFFKVDNEFKDWEQMLIMSLCDHNIIANSTFSWWSAFYNNNKDKIVVIPNKWFFWSIENNYVPSIIPNCRLEFIEINKINIVLVSICSFQEYIIDNINQLLKFNFNIHVLTNKKFFDKLNIFKNSINIVDSESINVNYFDKNSKLDKNFRNGFWNNCSKRLFLVYEYIKKYNIKHVVHLENDVLLYNNLNYNFEEKIYITMDSKNRCIPGIIYIPKYDLFTKLIENYDFTKNDMINLANFYNNNKEIVKTFPIIDNSIDKCMCNENFQKFNSIFDGAAIGQYLGGVDPRNIDGDTTGFVNETCEIKYNKYIFKWMKKVLNL